MITYSDTARATETGWLSDRNNTPLQIDGADFYSLEQYMVYCRAKLFNDDNSINKIMDKKTTSLDLISYRNQIRGFDDSIWQKYRTNIVLNGLRAKVAQIPGIRDKLLATGTELLAKTSLNKESKWVVNGRRIRDVSFINELVWTTGLNLSDTETYFGEGKEWPGQNLHGICWMQVRNEIQNN